jgi:hypothetical protein
MIIEFQRELRKREWSYASDMGCLIDMVLVVTVGNMRKKNVYENELKRRIIHSNILEKEH